MVKVGFKNYDTRVLPEMSAKVLFLKEAMKKELENEKPNLVVPKSAVVERNGQLIAFKVREEKAVQVIVNTGKDFGSYIEITNGLESGDEIVESVTSELKDGVKVKINK